MPVVWILRRYVALRRSLPARLEALSLDTLAAGLRDAEAPARPSLRQTVGTLRVLELALRRVPGIPDTCLYRALARYGVLAPLGFEPSFRLGTSDDGEHQHAWVEVDGRPVMDARASEFRVLYRFPEALG